MTTQENKSILRGGQFLVKQTDCNDIFTPEDFSEQQRMMKEAVIEFNDREIIVHRERFEAKDFALTEEVMRKAGGLGFLSVAVWVLYQQYLPVITSLAERGLSPLLLEPIQVLELCQSPSMGQKTKETNMYQS